MLHIARACCIAISSRRTSSCVRMARPVVLDFGLSAREELPTLTATGEIIGTPRYMAPGAAPRPERRRAHGCLRAGADPLRARHAASGARGEGPRRASRVRAARNHSAPSGHRSARIPRDLEQDSAHRARARSRRAATRAPGDCRGPRALSAGEPVTARPPGRSATPSSAPGRAAMAGPRRVRAVMERPLRGHEVRAQPRDSAFRSTSIARRRCGSMAPRRRARRDLPRAASRSTGLDDPGAGVASARRAERGRGLARTECGAGRVAALRVEAVHSRDREHSRLLGRRRASIAPLRGRGSQRRRERRSVGGVRRPLRCRAALADVTSGSSGPWVGSAIVSTAMKKRCVPIAGRPSCRRARPRCGPIWPRCSFISATWKRGCGSLPRRSLSPRRKTARTLRILGPPEDPRRRAGRGAAPSRAGLGARARGYRS